MKKFTLILASLFLTIFAFAQDSLLVDGLVTNLNGAVVDVTIITGDGQAAVLTTNADGSFNTYFLMNITQGFVSASIIDCNGETIVAEMFYTPNLPFVFLTLEYCENSTGDVFGCTDFFALNYNPAATIDDGSCIYDNGGGDSTGVECESGIPAQFYLCTFGNGANVEIEIVDDNGDVLFEQSGFNDMEIMYIDVCLEDEMCYTVNMSNSEETGWYGGYWWLNVNGAQTATDSLDDDLSEESGTMGFAGACPTEGCTDSEALNYNPDADIDDGSCLYLNDCECDDTYDPVCAYPLTGAGTFGEMETFDNECWALCQGAWIIYDGECGNPTIYGCTDPAAINYNASATEDDGSCFYIEDCLCDSIYAPVCGVLWSDSTATGNGLDTLTFDNECFALCVGAWIIGDGPCDDPWIYGCTDPDALNYNPEATNDDGSCQYPIDCDDTAVLLEISTNVWSDEISWSIADDSGNVVASGSGYDDNSMYYESLCLADGCFTIEMLDSFGDGWNGGSMTVSSDDGELGTFTLATGSIGEAVFGINADCGDPDVYGCTDFLALNYNPAATIDDGSCIYDNGGGDSTFCEAFFIAFPDSTGDNTIWAINLSQGENLDYFWDFGDGSTSSEEFPQYTYEGDGPYNLCLTVIGGTANGFTCTSTYCQEIGADMFPGFTEGGISGAPSQGFQLNVIADMANSIIEEELFSSFTVYPNPTAGAVTIQFDALQPATGQLQMFDLQGRQVVVERQNFNSGSNVISLDMTDVESGIYILSVSAGKTSKQQRVVRL